MFASLRLPYVVSMAFRRLQFAQLRGLQGADEAADLERIAHVFRRCGFGPRPGEVGQWRDEGAAALVESLLANEEIYALDEENLYDGFGGPDDIDDDVMFATFIDQMLDPVNPLHERLTWYWHTHFTSSVESSGRRYAWQQHHLVRRLALGNFQDLAREITTNPAMLYYLDGAGSRGDNPNENYAREFLELFTLGRDGGYTEDDVRAAARILSGWQVDWDTGEVDFDSERHYDRPVTFMGERKRWTIDSLIGFVCALPACHRHVVTRLYHHLVGPDLTDKRRNELAKVFADNGLEIKPLVAAMVRGDDFFEAIHSRARQPLEWAIAALNAVGYRSAADVELRHWQIDMLGQTPFLPPNVAGWPLDDRWGSPSQIIARTSILLDWELPRSTIDSVPPTVDAVLARCGIYDPSDSTRAALDTIEREHSEFDYRLELLFLTALTSPEFTLI